MQPGCTKLATTYPRRNSNGRWIQAYLTGKETEPWEILYFQGVQKSQLPVIEQALQNGSSHAREATSLEVTAWR